MHGWETRMLLRHYLEQGAVAAVRGEPPDDPRVDRDGAIGAGSCGRRDAVQPSAGGWAQAGPVQGYHRGAAGGVPAVVGEAAVRRGPGGRLHGRVRPCEGLCSGGAAAGASGGGGAVRDAGGAAGAGGLCDVHASLGPAACAGGGSEPFAAVVAGFYRRQTMAVLIEGLESAFGWFGGVPRELLFDQMRSVVLSDGRVGGGQLVLNADFLRFAAHWGFRPRSCRPYRAQSVEYTLFLSLPCPTIRNHLGSSGIGPHRWEVQ